VNFNFDCFQCFGPARLTRLPKLRATWSPEALTCIVHNFDSTKPAIIGSLVSDIGLLLIMLIGLLRLRRESGGFLALGRTLWRQVRWWQFPLAVVFPKSLM
jgi:hypothetical protein